jgi:alpha-galactosidase
MGGIARKIHELGFKAGIWLAPFLVNENLPLAKEHPDWFLKEGNWCCDKIG